MENYKNMVIIINFADSHFASYINEAARNYCLKYKTLLKCWSKYDINIEEKLNKNFSNQKYICDYFTKQIVGNWIKNLGDEEILDNSMFEHILKYSKSLFAEDRFTVVSNSEFNKDELGYQEYLVLYFNCDSINYQIF